MTETERQDVGDVGREVVSGHSKRRRYAFKIGAGWLLTVAALFAVGLPVPALVAGTLLALACTSATVLNFCIPSFLLAAGAAVFCSHRLNGGARWPTRRRS